MHRGITGGEEMGLGANLLGALVSWGAVWLFRAVTMTVLCSPGWEKMHGTWKVEFLLVSMFIMTAVLAVFALVFSVATLRDFVKKFLLRRQVPWVE